MTETTNLVHLRARFGDEVREVTVNYDLSSMRGDALEVIEDHLGGQSVYAWLRRWQQALAEGVRLSEFRTREIVAMVYLGLAQRDPETTWQHVSRSLSPYTVEVRPPAQAPAAQPAPADPQGPPAPFTAPSPWSAPTSSPG